jgi:hypothetical protein
LFVFELLIYKDVSPTGFEELNPCFIRVHLWLKSFRGSGLGFEANPFPPSSDFRLRQSFAVTSA